MLQSGVFQSFPRHAAIAAQDPIISINYICSHTLLNSYLKKSACHNMYFINYLIDVTSYFVLLDSFLKIPPGILDTQF